MLFLAILACFDPNARTASEAPTSDSGAHDSDQVDTAPDTAMEDTGDADTAIDTAVDTADTGAVEPIVIAIDLVEPSTVSTFGGDPITLYGGPYAADAVVSIGGTAGTVSAWTETTLSVVTPAGAEGAVDIAVTTSAGAGSAVGALTYVEPCTGVTPDPATVYMDRQTVNSVTVALNGCATGLYNASVDRAIVDITAFPASVDGTGAVTLTYYGNASMGLTDYQQVKLGTDQGEVTIDVVAN